MKKLAGRVAIVTGASKGIGACIGRRVLSLANWGDYGVGVNSHLIAKSFGFLAERPSPLSDSEQMNQRGESYANLSG